MTMRSFLFKAGALYVLGRIAREITMDDVKKWSRAVRDVTPADMRRFAVDTSDSALLRLGLVRAATVPSSTLLVLGGFTAGAALGAGLMYLIGSEQGKQFRGKITERVRRGNGYRTQSNIGTETGIGGMQGGAAGGSSL